MSILNSKIILAKGIKMDKEYVNVLSYNSTQLLALLNSNDHYVNSSNTFAFIGGKNTNIISCPFSYNECLMSNYIAFQNPSYSNKWFFAFITNVIYKSDGMTQIEFEIDAWSTWFENWTKKHCYVLREHVNDDTIGANTVPENLNVEEVIQEGQSITDSSYSDYFWVAITTAWIPDTSEGSGEQFSGITMVNKQIFGEKICLFRIANLNDAIQVGLFIIRTNGDGHINDITNMFIVPEAVIDQPNLVSHVVNVGQYTCTFYTAPNSYDIKSFATLIPKVTSFNGVNVKNNKAFVYPYNYLLVSNNVGNQNIYKYENFSDETNATFINHLVLNIGGSGRLIPTNYKNMLTCDDESIPLAKYPTCEWSADSFINWISQESVNMSTSIALDVVGMGSNNQEKSNSATTGLNIAKTIANQIGAFYKASLLPNIKGGQNTGNVAFASGRNCFTFRCMRVKTEYLKIIDDYWSRFGYSINRVKEPNITGRQNFNYVEIGSSEEIGNGEVPTNFMNTINNACRKGVTIWHNHENLGNFNVSNNIV